MLTPPLDWRVELQEGLRTRAAVTCRNIMLDAILYLEKLATCRYIMWEAVLCVEKLETGTASVRVAILVPLKLWLVPPAARAQCELPLSSLHAGMDCGKPIIIERTGIPKL